MKKIFPEVNYIQVFKEKIKVENPLKIFFFDEKVNAFIDFDFFKIKFETVKKESTATVLAKQSNELEKEGYKIVIDEKISISYFDNSGLFYALCTLDQIIEEDSVEKAKIVDYPTLSVRGFMLDISRNKVPKISEIKKLIDLMARLKMNHLELYVEGFSFEYQFIKESEKLKHLVSENKCITLSEFIELSKYAKSRFIDLVPNQNGFGHMTKWLELDEYKDLACCPEGINLWGRWREPSTLNPLDERSLELVKKMYQDMIPYSDSQYFNMNFDEPFELGHGKTEGMNREDLYIDYLNKAIKEVKKYHKKPLMWGDVLVRHEDKWDKLDKDVIFIDWGYDANYPFASHAKKLNEKNVEFMCAPGTTSWSSFLGRFLDWYENIKNSVDAVYDYNGKGILLTDWGDFGHIQFWPISLSPLIYAGMYSWSHKEGTILKVRDYLNTLFEDDSQIFGDLLLDLNHYSRYDLDYGGNGTRSFYTFMWASVAIKEAKKANISAIDYFLSKACLISKEKHILLSNLFNQKAKELDLLENKNDKLKLAVNELKQSISLLQMIIDFSYAMNMYSSLNNLSKPQLDNTTNDIIFMLEKIIDKKEKYIENQKTLWLARNKLSDLDESISYQEDFFSLVEETKQFLMKRGNQ